MKLNNDSRRKFLKDTALVTAAASMPSLFTQARSNRKAGEKVKMYIETNNKLPSKEDKNKDIKQIGQWISTQKKSRNLWCGVKGGS